MREIILVLGIFMVSGGMGFAVALLGYQIPTRSIPMFLTTPFAFLLVATGSVGVLFMANSRKHNHAWLRLIVGFGMTLLAWIWLDTLLMEVWK